MPSPHHWHASLSDSDPSLSQTVTQPGLSPGHGRGAGASSKHGRHPSIPLFIPCSEQWCKELERSFDMNHVRFKIPHHFIFQLVYGRGHGLAGAGCVGDGCTAAATCTAVHISTQLTVTTACSAAAHPAHGSTPGPAAAVTATVRLASARLPTPAAASRATRTVTVTVTVATVVGARGPFRRRVSEARERELQVSGLRSSDSEVLRNRAFPSRRIARSKAKKC